jgi:hypothetical protein
MQGDSTIFSHVHFSKTLGARSVTVVSRKTWRMGTPKLMFAKNLSRRFPMRRGERKVRVYAFGGWGVGAALGRARQAKRASRRRFGIETSYRRLNEGKGRTTKKDLVYRLLLLGLALLLRQGWVWLTWQLACAWGCGRRVWLGELPLRRLLDWLGDEIRQRYKEERSLDLGRLLQGESVMPAA